MIFSLRPEGIGDYTPEERHNVPWPSCTLGRIGCPSGAGTPNTAGGYRDRIYIGSLLGPDLAMNLSGLFFDPLTTRANSAATVVSRGAGSPLPSGCRRRSG